MLWFALIVAVACQSPPPMVARLDFEAEESAAIFFSPAARANQSCVVGTGCLNLPNGGRVELSPNSPMFGEDGGAICAWVFVRSADANSRLVSQGVTSEATTTNFAIALTSPLLTGIPPDRQTNTGQPLLDYVWRFRVRIRPSNTTVPFTDELYAFDNSTRPLLRAWQHVCASVSRRGAKLFVNGQLANSSAHVGARYAPLTPAPPFMIGQVNQSQIGQYQLDGMVDDVRIFNATDSTQEVTTGWLLSILAPMTTAATTTAATAAPQSTSSGASGLTLPPGGGPTTAVTATAVAAATTTTTASAATTSGLPSSTAAASGPSQSGVIGGAVGGGIAALVVVAVALGAFFVCRRRRRQAANSDPPRRSQVQGEYGDASDVRAPVYADTVDVRQNTT